MIKIFPKTLAIDWGTKKLGLAIGESSLGIRLLPVRAVSRNLIVDLKDLMTKESIEQILIGQQADRRFIDDLKRHLGLPIIFEDEAFTSEEAKRLIKDTQPRRQSVDSAAAALMLEQYFLRCERKFNSEASETGY